jgi:glycosyltransferase involved in cell wall biosynthesis
MASQTPRGGLRRLALAGPSALSLLRSRGGFMRAAVDAGCSVLALAPDATGDQAAKLQAFGVEVRALPPARPALSLFPGRKTASAFKDAFTDWNAHAVLATGPSVVPYAVAAARAAKVSRVAVLAGDLPERGLSRRLRSAFAAADAIIVHNGSDGQGIRAALGEKTPLVLRVPGSGADLDIAAGIDMPSPSAGEKLIFLCIARLDRVKGVHDYLEAARLALAQGVQAEFLLAGPAGTQTGAATPETLARYGASVRYLGDLEHPVPAIRRAHVLVVPSHREGMPHVALSALAAARPLIVTDIPGSRETVDDMINGTLAAPRDPASLAAAFKRLCAHRDLLPVMAQASRRKAERLFGMDSVNAELLKALHLV